MVTPAGGYSPISNWDLYAYGPASSSSSQGSEAVQGGKDVQTIPDPIASITVQQVSCGHMTISWPVDPDTTKEYIVCAVESTLPPDTIRDRVNEGTDGPLPYRYRGLIRYDETFGWTSDENNPSFDPSIEARWDFFVPHNGNYTFFVLVKNADGFSNPKIADGAIVRISGILVDQIQPDDITSLAIEPQPWPPNTIKIRLTETSDPNNDPIVYKIFFGDETDYQHHISTGGNDNNYIFNRGVITLTREQMTDVGGGILEAVASTDDAGNLLPIRQPLVFGSRAVDIANNYSAHVTPLVHTTVSPDYLAPLIINSCPPVGGVAVKPVWLVPPEIGMDNINDFVFFGIDSTIWDSVSTAVTDLDTLRHMVENWEVSRAWQFTLPSATASPTGTPNQYTAARPISVSDWGYNLPAGTYVVFISYKNQFGLTGSVGDVTTNHVDNVVIAKNNLVTGPKAPAYLNVWKAEHDGQPGYWFEWPAVNQNTEGENIEAAKYLIVYGMKQKPDDQIQWFTERLEEVNAGQAVFNKFVPETSLPSAPYLFFAIAAIDQYNNPPLDRLFKMPGQEPAFVLWIDDDNPDTPIFSQDSPFWRGPVQYTEQTEPTPTIGPNPTRRGEVVTFYHLPEDGQVWIYNAEGLLIAGPLRSSGEGGRCQWTVPSSVEINKDCYCVIEGEKQTWRLPLRIYGGTR